LAADFFEFGRSGIVWNRQQTIEALAQEPLMERSMRDFTTRLLSESVVLVTYRSVLRDPVSSKEWHTLRSSVWKLIDGRWQIIFHQGTPTQSRPANRSAATPPAVIGESGIGDNLDNRTRNGGPRSPEVDRRL
jgi:hypothetical protein